MPPIPKKLTAAPTLTPPTGAAGAAPTNGVIKGPKPPAPKHYKLGSEMRSGDKAITKALAQQLLGWEDEIKYKARCGSAGNGQGVPGFGKEFLFKDSLFGNVPIRCWYNTKNRPFDLAWAKALAQMILQSGPELDYAARQWKLNGEPILIGEHGQVLSGQHRLVGLVIACEMWSRDKEFYKNSWLTEPTIESVITVGISEAQDTIMTIDNVKPRNLGDVFYTSNIFAGLAISQRKWCSDAAAKAVEFLWKRTGVSDTPGMSYQTHPASISFFDRHKEHLMLAVDHIFKIDCANGRPLSALGLRTGDMIGMLYLMGCSKTDPDEGYTTGRTEDSLDWSRWEDAKEFWVDLVTKRETTFSNVIRALAGTVADDEAGPGGGGQARNIVITKAWRLYIEGEELELDRIMPEYAGEGLQRQLISSDDLEGIDNGPPKKKLAGGVPTEDARAEQEADDKKLAAMKARSAEALKKKALPAPPPLAKKPVPKPAPRPVPAPLKK